MKRLIILWAEFKHRNCECKEVSIKGYQFEANEDRTQRFEAYNWHLPSLEDGKRFGRDRLCAARGD